MPLTTDRINDIVTGIKNNLSTIYPSSDGFNTAVTFLGNDISLPEPAPVSSTENNVISLAWGVVSGGSVQTANAPDALPSTAINFDQKASVSTRTVVFRNGPVITGIMEVSPAVASGIYGAPFYVSYIQVNVVEV